MCEAVERLVESRRPEWEKVGEKRGEKRGAQAEKKRIVLAMLRENYSFDQISKISDLSVDEIKQIDTGKK